MIVYGKIRDEREGEVGGGKNILNRFVLPLDNIQTKLKSIRYIIRCIFENYSKPGLVTHAK